MWDPANVHPVRVTEFWMLVDRGGLDDCWPFMGYTEDGYGRFEVDGRMVGAHEIALTFATGEQRLSQLQTCHRCNNPACCNPRHLRFDTPASNVADMFAAGRQNNPAKLTDEQVVLIRERRAAGAAQDDLAIQFGISSAMVSMLVRGTRRSNAGGPIAPPRAAYHRRTHRRATT